MVREASKGCYGYLRGRGEQQMSHTSSVPVQVAMIALVHSDMETLVVRWQVLGNTGLRSDDGFHSGILA